MSNDIAIKVENVSKTFKLPHEKSTSIKSLVINVARRKTTFERQKVLDGVSFEIRKGEFVGIVGRNGSGKSTLLKLMAGIYAPSKGSIQVNGKLTPFIELGVGFNPELTGRENVYLNGALLGFNRADMAAMYEDIVDFAELHRFMDQKLKNYSSGMQVRLAFSIAIRAQSEILLLDEVLAVGDESFQKKCFDYFATLKENKQTVILVTHDMESVRRFCDRALYIEKGEILLDDAPGVVASEYSRKNALNSKKKQNKEEKKVVEKRPDYPVTIKAKIENASKFHDPLKQGETIKISAKITAKNLQKEIIDAEVGISFREPSGRTIYIGSTTRNKIKGLDFRSNGDSHTIRFDVENIFPVGEYVISMAVLNLIRKETYARSDDFAAITVYSDEPAGWLLKAPTKISVS